MAPCGMQLGEKCLEQGWSRPLITSCCFDHVSALCVCVCVCALRGPGGSGLSLYGRGPQVNILFKLLHTLYNAIFHSHGLSSGDTAIGLGRVVLY